DLLIANCDEFIYYDDLVREEKKARKPAKQAANSTNVPKSRENVPKKDEDNKKQEAIDLVLATVEALVAERGEEEKIWSSLLKQTLKRRNPGFNESYYGFRSFKSL